MRGKPIIVYADQDKIYAPDCIKVKRIHIENFTEQCFEHLPIKFEYEKTNVTGFLTSDGIIRKFSTEVDCKRLDDIYINPVYTFERKGNLIIPSERILYETMFNVDDRNFQPLNLRHYEQILKGVDVMFEMKKLIRFDDQNKDVYYAKPQTPVGEEPHKDFGNLFFDMITSFNDTYKKPFILIGISIAFVIVSILVLIIGCKAYFIYKRCRIITQKRVNAIARAHMNSRAGTSIQLMQQPRLNDSLDKLNDEQLKGLIRRLERQLN